MPRRSSPDPQSPPGSPSPGEPVFLAVGRLGRAHGIHGDLILEVLTDFPERLKPGTLVYIGQEHRPLRLARSRQHSQGLLVAFEGITSPEEAAKLRNQLVLVRADDRPSLEEGEYYHHQLLGLQVVTEKGQVLGQLVEILETGANDVYIVRSQESAEVLLPATEEVILSIDLQAGQILIRPLPGLLPEE
jgi:16S rRNA processing protein RimM